MYPNVPGGKFLLILILWHTNGNVIKTHSKTHSPPPPKPLLSVILFRFLGVNQNYQGYGGQQMPGSVSQPNSMVGQGNQMYSGGPGQFGPGQGGQQGVPGAQGPGGPGLGPGLGPGAGQQGRPDYMNQGGPGPGPGPGGPGPGVGGPGGVPGGGPGAGGAGAQMTPQQRSMMQQQNVRPQYMQVSKPSNGSEYYCKCCVL